MSSAARPSDRSGDADSPEARVDRALLEFLSDPTPERQAVLWAAAQDSPEALAEIQEFLAGDAELQHMMGALSPLASQMLASERQAAAQDADEIRLDEDRLPPLALGGEPGEAAAEASEDGWKEAGETPAAGPVDAAPGASEGTSHAATWRTGALVRMILAGLAAAAILAAGVALWVATPGSEPTSEQHAMRALAPQTKARRPFVPSGDLWKPPVATPGVWHYRLGEDDAGARAGEPAGESAADRLRKHPLERHGKPKFAAGLAPGSSLSAAFASGEGFSGPVMTTAVDNFCLEAWFTPRQSANAMVVNNGNGGTNGFGLLLHDNGHPGRTTYMGLYGGNRFLDTNVNVAPGQAVHLAVVRASQQTTVYLNGKPFPHGTAHPNAADGVFQIGQTAGFQGEIDEVRVWVFPPGGFKLGDLMYPAVNVEPAKPPR